MFKFISGNFKEFWKGFGISGITGGAVVFIQNVFLLDVLSKLLIACMVAGVGGFTTALVSDIYKHHIQKKLFKEKKDGESKPGKKEKAA